MHYFFSSIKKAINTPLFLFLFVGGTSTVIQFITLIVLVEFFYIDGIISSSFGYAFSAICNYLLNYYITFKSDKHHSEALSKFLIVVIFGLCLNAIGFWIFNQITSHYLFSQFAALVITTISNYLLHKHWIYKVEKHHE